RARSGLGTILVVGRGECARAGGHRNRTAPDLRGDGDIPLGRAVAYRGAGASGVVGVESLRRRVRPAVGFPGAVPERLARRSERPATEAGAGDRYPDDLVRRPVGGCGGAARRAT